MSQEILDLVSLVNVDFGIWSAYKRTTEQDLVKLNANLPGDGVITKGGKKIFPPEHLAKFHALKKEITRKVSSLGVAAFGGTARAVPTSSLEEVEKYLEDAKGKYQALIADFSSNYDSNLASHIASITDPLVQEIVRGSVMPAQDAVGRFRYDWNSFKIVPNGGDGKAASLVGNLAGKLYAEIAQGAKEAYEKSFLGKPRVGQKALHQIVALRDKLAGLSMLDGQNITSIINMMDDVLSRLPKTGWVEGVDMSALVGLVFIMSDPERMLKHAEKIQHGQSAAQAVADAAAQAATAEAGQDAVDVQAEQEAEVTDETESVIEAEQETAEDTPEAQAIVLVAEEVAMPAAVEPQPVTAQAETLKVEPPAILVTPVIEREVSVEVKLVPPVRTPAKAPRSNSAAFF